MNGKKVSVKNTKVNNSKPTNRSSRSNKSKKSNNSSSRLNKSKNKRSSQNIRDEEIVKEIRLLFVKLDKISKNLVDIKERMSNLDCVDPNNRGEAIMLQSKINAETSKYENIERGIAGISKLRGYNKLVNRARRVSK